MNVPPPPPAGAPAPTSSAKPHPRGTLILVLGIVSLFICGIILGVVAYVMGTQAIKEIDQNPSAYSNRGMVNAGRILGAIGAALSVVFLIVLASG